MRFWQLCRASCLLVLFVNVGFSQPKPRARDLGVPFDGTPGPLNAITDVKGVEVGFTTLISGSGKLKVGEGRSRRSALTVFGPPAEEFSRPTPYGNKSWLLRAIFSRYDSSPLSTLTPR